MLRSLPAAALLFLIGAGAVRAAEPETRRPWTGEPGYCRFPGTISPDGAWVLAWAPKELPQEVLASLKEWAPDLEIKGYRDEFDNFLMNAVEGRLLAKLPGFDYFDGHGWRRNQGWLYIAWAPDSRRALAICEDRWNDPGIVWIEPEANRVTNVKEAMEMPYRRVLLARTKKRSEFSIQFTEPALLPGGVLIVNAGAIIPREGPVFSDRLKYRFKSEGGKVRCELLKARKILRSEESTTGLDYEPDLNLYYGKLRARLEGKARAALQKEEEEWLKWRAAQPEEAQRQLTERRASELRARAEN